MNTYDRVGVWVSSDDDTVTMIGYGTYLGESEDSPAGWRGSKIKLDNGEVVWANEGSGLIVGLEQSMMKRIDGREIKFMTVAEFRRAPSEKPPLVEQMGISPLLTPPPVPKKPRRKRKC